MQSTGSMIVCVLLFELKVLALCMSAYRLAGFFQFENLPGRYSIGEKLQLSKTI